MNKTLIGLLVACVLAVAALLVLRKRETADPYENFPERDFSVRDTHRIHKLFIADRKGRTMTFTRQPTGHWLINDSVRASPTIMVEMLSTLRQLQIDFVPPRAMQATARKALQADALKVEAYDAEGERIKSILFGNSTAGTKSTFAVIEGFDEPFAVRRGMSSGTVRPLFDLRSVESFRDRDFIAVAPERIASVEVRYPTAAAESFRIARVGDSLRLDPLQELVAARVRPAPQRLLESYLEGFSEVPLFYRANDDPKKDSIVALVPQVQILLSLEDGSRDTFEVQPSLNLNLYGRPDPQVAWSQYWVERGARELVVVQDHQIQQLLRGYSSFFP